jgi:hypothetical protein
MKDGQFTQRILWRVRPWIYRYVTPMVDSEGRVWVRGPRDQPWVFNPSTGKLTVLKARGGNLLRDRHGTMWYVRGPGTPY